MTIEFEDTGPVRTIIHDRYEARNAMDPDSAVALHRAMLDFDANPDLSVAVLWWNRMIPDSGLLIFLPFRVRIWDRLRGAVPPWLRK